MTTGAAPAQAQVPPTQLTVIIESIVEIDDPEDGFGEGSCWGDYVFDVGFAGSTSTSPEFSIDPGFGTGCIIGRPETIEIGYAVTRTVDTTATAIPLSIEVTDVDTFNDDTIDVSPVPGQKVLRLSVDPFTGAFSITDDAGDPVPGISFPGGVTAATIEGDGDDDRGGLNIRIEATGSNDADGDGLLDSWETGGFDADRDGTVDLDLPGWGADPNRRDMFVELDTANGRTLGRDDIQAMKDAFAAAPVTNPDGSTGITLWVDTGGAVDPGAREGEALGTCGDGLDNGGDGGVDGADGDCAAILQGGSPYLDASVEDPGGANCTNGGDDDGDGLADGADPDCVVGDSLGGGNAIAGAPAICNLNAAFYTAKGANFAANRAAVFRYAVSTPGAAGCGSGGQAEIGGNDFVDHNGDGGTIMHELGHTLTLRHGGFEDDNCKPNHVSVMSYFNQFGVGRVGGGVILDYAPVRRGLLGGPRSTALTTSALDEAALSESTPLDATDGANRFVFTNGAGTAGWWPVAGQPNGATPNWVDWDGDTTVDGGTVPVNVDTSDTASGNPANCTNAAAPADTHEGADEWRQVSVPFRQFGDSATAARNPAPDTEPTREEVEELVAGLTRADVSVTVADAPDPVAAGAEVAFTATATNHGPAPADAVEVVLAADDRLTPTTLPAGCAAGAGGAGPGEVRCALGTLASGQAVDVTVPYLVDADLVYEAGGPTTVDTEVGVSHAGQDPAAGNDAEVEQTLVVAVADLAVDELSVTEQPPLLVLGEPATFTLGADVSNGGPSSPMDAEVTFTATGTGITATPQAEPVTALAAGSPQAVSGGVEVTCTEPGLRTITVGAAIAPARADDTDPEAANDGRTATIEVDCAVPVAADVTPGDPQDRLPSSSTGNVFVGVFTTDAGEYDLPLAFDATTILGGTVRFGRAADVQTGGGVAPRFADVADLREHGADEQGRDRDADQRLRFVREDVPLDVGETEACVIGRFVAADGTELTFYGCTDVVVTPLGGA